MAKYDSVLLILAVNLSFIFSEGYLENGGLAPVVLVPGLGGSQLEAKLNKPRVKHYFCSQETSEFFTLWLDVKELLPIVIDCWLDNMKLNYDDSFNKTYNQPGVMTRVPDFGNPKLVEYLDPNFHLIGGYLNSLVGALVDIGYIRQKNLFAALYDFRKGPSELSTFFDDLEKLIEYAYDYNNSSVILIGHSMGGQLIHNFLNDKSQEWKDKFVQAFISLSTPFGGTMKAVKSFAVGDNMGIFLLHPDVLKEMFSTLPSMTYLLPVKELWGNEVIVSTAEKNYTLDDLEEFFDDIGNPNAWKMYLNEKDFTSDLSSPGVELHCLYGKGSGTLKRLIYESSGLHGSPLMEYEDGDGTVNLRSLEYCKNWITQQKERVSKKSFEGIDHMGIINDAGIIAYIIGIVKELSNC